MDAAHRKRAGAGATTCADVRVACYRETTTSRLPERRQPEAPLAGPQFLRVPLVLVNDPRRDDLPDLGLRSQCTWVRRGHDLLPTMDIDREVSYLKASDE